MTIDTLHGRDEKPRPSRDGRNCTLSFTPVALHLATQTSGIVARIVDKAPGLRKPLPNERAVLVNAAAGISIPDFWMSVTELYDLVRDTANLETIKARDLGDLYIDVQNGLKKEEEIRSGGAQPTSQSYGELKLRIGTVNRRRGQVNKRNPTLEDAALTLALAGIDSTLRIGKTAAPETESSLGVNVDVLTGGAYDIRVTDIVVQADEKEKLKEFRELLRRRSRIIRRYQTTGTLGLEEGPQADSIRKEILETIENADAHKDQLTTRILGEQLDRRRGDQASGFHGPTPFS